MSPSTASSPFRASLLLSRRSLSLSARDRHSSWSFGSSQLIRGVSMHSLSRDDDEKKEPKIAKAAAKAATSGSARWGANDSGRHRRRNLRLHHARAFSANLPGERPERDAEGAAVASAVGPLGYRRDDDQEGARTPAPPPPPPPLAAARASTSSSSSSSSFSYSSEAAASHFSSSPHATPHSRADSAALARELHTVTVAIAANAAIFAAKACAYAATGSSAMLAECVHSVVDCANQALLRLGVTRSRRPPTALHPYGFMKDKFVWSLVSAVRKLFSVFFFGGGGGLNNSIRVFFISSPCLFSSPAHTQTTQNQNYPRLPLHPSSRSGSSAWGPASPWPTASPH